MRRMQQAKEKSHEGVGNLLDLGGIDMEEAKIDKQGQLDAFRGLKAKTKIEVFYILKYNFKQIKYYLNSIILF